MPTVDKHCADIIAANNGVYPGDEHLPPVVRITQYDNAFGGVGVDFGLDYEGEDNYQPSDFIRNPRIYFERKTT